MKLPFQKTHIIPQKYESRPIFYGSLQGLIQFYLIVRDKKKRYFFNSGVRYGY